MKNLVVLFLKFLYNNTITVINSLSVDYSGQFINVNGECISHFRFAVDDIVIMAGEVATEPAQDGTA